MAKLERYVGQLVDDRGGVDVAVLENIVKDIERSSRVKRVLKQVGEHAHLHSARALYIMPDVNYCVLLLLCAYVWCSCFPHIYVR